MKKALITGITGQDGAYLAKLLLDKGYKVYGTYRRLSTPNFWRLRHLDVFDKVNLIPFDLGDMSSIVESIKISKPDEIYNLAAQSYVGAAFEQPLMTGQVDGLAVAMFMEAIRNENIDIKFYQASTSEMYGNVNVSKKPLNENDQFQPVSPYAAAKLYAYWTTKIYREGYKLFTCNGILFNHESPLRGLEFVTRKISNAVAKIYLGLENELALGNVSSMRDWGYAPEYVEAMWNIMQQDEPEDFVIATGETHSVKDFVEEAFKVFNLDPEKYVKSDKKYMRPIDVNCLIGDSSKATKAFGWKPKMKFNDLVKIMVNADVDRWQRLLNGETFPWDAPNYTSEAHIISRKMRD